MSFKQCGTIYLQNRFFNTECNKEFFYIVIQPGINNLCELCVPESPMYLVPIAVLRNATYVPTFGNCQPKHTT